MSMTDAHGTMAHDCPVTGTRPGIEAVRLFQDRTAHLFATCGNECEELKTAARVVSSAVELSGRFVECHTSVVCPECLSVCCINRHSYPEPADIVCMYALGERPPQYDAKVGDTEPCQFLGKKGCTLRRPLRPHRCNWYFCSPLLEHIQTVSAPAYRDFIAGLREINEKREALLAAFYDVLKKAGYGPESQIDARMKFI